MREAARSSASLWDVLRVWPLYPLPHHALSRGMLAATRIERPAALKNFAIRRFVRRYGVDLDDAVEPDPAAYASFNEFFTRALRPEARPLTDRAQAVACPIDGRVSQIGRVECGEIFQAKGRTYSLPELVGGDERAGLFRAGAFANLYLSPRDYHRIHMPIAGTLVETVYVPGRLFPVAPHSVRTVPRLFARNERLVALFETAVGPMAVVAVGALFVGCIETVWAGVVTPPRGRFLRVDDYRGRGVRLERGQELGRFNMGSTVLLLFGAEAVRWREDLAAGVPVRMGEWVGHCMDP